MEKGLPLSSYLIPFLENCQGHSSQNKRTSISAYFYNIPTCTNHIFYLLCSIGAKLEQCAFTSKLLNCKKTIVLLRFKNLGTMLNKSSAEGAFPKSYSRTTLFYIHWDKIRKITSITIISIFFCWTDVIFSGYLIIHVTNNDRFDKDQTFFKFEIIDET